MRDWIRRWLGAASAAELARYGELLALRVRELEDGMAALRAAVALVARQAPPSTVPADALEALQARVATLEGGAARAGSDVAPDAAPPAPSKARRNRS